MEKVNNEKSSGDSEETGEIKDRREKAKKWLKDPYNLAILAILIAGFITRVYYLSFASGQTLWWDESEYGAMAKKYAFGVPYDLSPKRPFMFSGIISLLFSMNLSEQTVKFLMIVIPSTLLILFVYFLGKEMFDKKVGIIAALLTSVSWTLLFWTTRLQPDSFSLAFQVLAVLFMWKFFKAGSQKHAFLAGMFASLGFAFKVSGMLVPIVLFVFIMFKDRLSAFRNKGYWLFILAFAIFQIPQLVYSQIAFSNPLAIFGTDYVTLIAETSMPFAWYNFNFYYYFTENILFFLFLLGVIIALGFLLYIDVMFKDKSKFLNPNFFCILLFVLVSAYYIFWIKGTDDRWVFLWLPFIFFMIGNASVYILNFVKKYNKILAFLIVIALLSYGAYSQLAHNDALIKVKKDSYSQVKDVGIWMKDNSDKSDLIIANSLPQITYYSERKVNPIPRELSEFEEFLTNDKPKFLEISVFEFMPDWLSAWIQSNQNRLEVKRAHFADAAQTQVLVVVYEIKY